MHFSSGSAPAVADLPTQVTARAEEMSALKSVKLTRAHFNPVNCEFKFYLLLIHAKSHQRKWEFHPDIKPTKKGRTFSNTNINKIRL